MKFPSITFIIAPVIFICFFLPTYFLQLLYRITFTNLKQRKNDLSASLSSLYTKAFIEIENQTKLLINKQNNNNNNNYDIIIRSQLIELPNNYIVKGTNRTLDADQINSNKDKIKLNVIIAYKQDKAVKKHSVASSSSSYHLPTDLPYALLLHGFPETWHCWHLQLPLLLSKGYCCIIPEQRGYGCSEKPSSMYEYSIRKLVGDSLALLDILHIPTCTLFAHDWGGYIAYSLASQFTSRINKLIMIDGPHPNYFLYHCLYHGNFSQIFKSWYIFFFQLPLVPEIMFGTDPEDMGKKMFRKGFSEFDRKLLAAAHAQPMAMKAQINWYRHIAVGHLLDGDDFPCKSVLLTPTLILWGAKDTALEPCLGSDIPVSALPNREFHLIEGGSHWLQRECPEQVNHFIQQFLQK